MYPAVSKCNAKSEAVANMYDVNQLLNLTLMVDNLCNYKFWS